MKVKLLFALFALAATAVWAQDTARLSGSVTDGTGSFIPGATVTLRLAGGEGVLATTTTTAEGLYSFIGLRPVTVDVVAESTGFRKQIIRSLKLDSAKETSLPPIALEVGSITETVEVTGIIQSVQTTNAEMSTTVTNEQVRRLPILNRSAINLIQLQPGVTWNGRTTTVINGLRSPYASSTYDGIEIQDNFIRSNALDFQPNRLFQDQVAEVTIVTGNAGAMFAGGAGQVVFVSPSGGNDFHGSVYWYNRNNAYAANDWFDNRDGIPNAFLNQNQGGATFGGPAIKNKLLFYGNYEGFRLHQQSSINRRILTADARNGTFTYLNGGAVRKTNVLALRGLSINPAIAPILQQVPGAEKINNFRTGDSSENLLRNTAGYSFLARNNTMRDNLLAKVDYLLSAHNTFAGTFSWNRETVDRNDTGVANDYSTIPKAGTETTRPLLSLAWRSTPSATITNELRGGFFKSPTRFITSEQFGSVILNGFSFDNPLNTFRNQGRYTDTYHLQDNASYIRGRHQIQFGYQYKAIRVSSYDEAGITPTYTMGMSSRNALALTTTDLPGISGPDLTAANLLLASLGGFVTTSAQTFNVKDRTSGYVNGQSANRNFTLDNHAFYVQDNFKVRPRLALTLGVRWDYWTPVDESSALGLLPVLNGNVINTLLNANGTLDFAGKSVGRRWYKRDLNNFAPNVGLAWDIFGNGKTALRMGYSINYVNDEMISSIYNNVNTNNGLSSGATQSGLTGVAGSLGPLPTPTYKVPRTYADNYALSTQSAIGLPDPNLVTPYVQQWSLGLQHEIHGFVLEGRYVGNHATKAFRAFDFNQVVIKENGFLDDFKRARSNGFLALAAGRGFDPRYNSAVPGSQQLPVFDSLEAGGLLTNGTVANYIRTGEAGELANIYQTNQFIGANFYRNANALGTNLMTNYSNSTYNAFQFEVRRRAAKGLLLQGSYNFSKVLSDALGDTSSRFEAFLDINNGAIERSRAPYDMTHQVKINYVYDLPFGKGRTFNFGGIADKVLGGWSLSGNYTWQSGNPFSVLSGRGTLNRAGRSSATNTAVTTLNGSQLDDLFQLRMTPNGPRYVAASATGPDGRAVAADGATPFSGQVFFQPGPGEIGSLQRRYFNGPSVWKVDMGLQKKLNFTERISLELRMETFNTFNHATFYIGDQTITSATFGVINSTWFDRRVIQIGGYLRF